MKRGLPSGFGHGNGHGETEAAKREMLRLLQAEMQKFVDEAGITGVTIEFDPVTSEVIARGEDREACERALQLFADEEKKDDAPPGQPEGPRNGGGH